MIFIALGTVGLWCANSALDKYVGQMGIVAIVPMVFFFGFGLLNKASPLHLAGPLNTSLKPAIIVPASLACGLL